VTLSKRSAFEDDPRREENLSIQRLLADLVFSTIFKRYFSYTSPQELPLGFPRCPSPVVHEKKTIRQPSFYNP
jgi:hypothetical protein